MRLQELLRLAGLTVAESRLNELGENDMVDDEATDPAAAAAALAKWAPKPSKKYYDPETKYASPYDKLTGGRDTDPAMSDWVNSPEAAAQESEIERKNAEIAKKQAERRARMKANSDLAADGLGESSDSDDSDDSDASDARIAAALAKWAPKPSKKFYDPETKYASPYDKLTGGRDADPAMSDWANSPEAAAQESEIERKNAEIAKKQAERRARMKANSDLAADGLGESDAGSDLARMRKLAGI